MNMIDIINRYQDEFPNSKEDLTNVFYKMDKVTDEIASLIRDKNLEALVAEDFEKVLVYSDFLKDINSYKNELSNLSENTSDDWWQIFTINYTQKAW